MKFKTYKQLLTVKAFIVALFLIGAMPSVALASEKQAMDDSITRAEVAVKSARMYAEVRGPRMAVMRYMDLDTAQMLLKRAKDLRKDGDPDEVMRLANNAETLAICVKHYKGPLCGMDVGDDFWIKGESDNPIIQLRLIGTLEKLISALQTQIENTK